LRLPFVFGCVSSEASVLVTEPGIVRACSFHLHGAAGRRGHAEPSLRLCRGLGAAAKAARPRNLRLTYPRIKIRVRQLCRRSALNFRAAGSFISHCRMPATPAFSLCWGFLSPLFRLRSSAMRQGGLGVLEYVSSRRCRAYRPAKVLAALIVFRRLYLIIPFIVAVCVAILLRTQSIGEALRPLATALIRSRSGGCGDRRRPRTSRSRAILALPPP